MTDETSSIDIELRNLVSKIIGSFQNVVAKEEDLSNVLLKGHLVIENFLEELLAVLNIEKTINIHRLSFHEKLKHIKESAEKDPAYLKNRVGKILPSLYALNGVRNDLAHDYTFTISEPEIDKIGVNLGSRYILKKYSSGHESYKENLLFCIDEIIGDIGRIIYNKICDLREKNQKQQRPQTPQQHQTHKTGPAVGGLG